MALCFFDCMSGPESAVISATSVSQLCAPHLVLPPGGGMAEPEAAARGQWGMDGAVPMGVGKAQSKLEYQQCKVISVSKFPRKSNDSYCLDEARLVMGMTKFGDLVDDENGV